MCRPSFERSACASFVPRRFIIAKRDRTGTWSRAPIVVDDLDEPFVTRLIGILRRELRVDQQQRHAGGARRRDAAFHRGAKKRLVDADERVVGADLPDHEFRPAGFQRGLEPLQRLDGQFAADAGVPDVRGDAVVMCQLVLETRRIGVRGRAGADPLGGRRTDRQDFKRAVRAAVQVRELRSVGFKRRRRAGTSRFVRARRRHRENERADCREPR